MANEEIKVESYNEAVKELESILQKMQSPDCDIDKLSEYTAGALKLLKYCKEKLSKTDEELKKTLESLS